MYFSLENFSWVVAEKAPLAPCIFVFDLMTLI